MTVKVYSSGPPNAKIMIVGEAPGAQEVFRGEPFVGESGKLLDAMLHEAGILRSECYITNVCKVRPPGNDIKKMFLKHTTKTRIPGPEIQEGIKELEEEISKVNPNIIIALGDTALWATTGETGITNWRGSIMEPLAQYFTKVIPTFHPAAILRKWDWRWIAVHDLKRAKEESEFPEIRYPDYKFIVRPEFTQVMELLNKLIIGATDAPISPVGRPENVSRAQLPIHQWWRDDSKLRLSVDIETRRGHIACIGIAWSSRDAICIPLMCKENKEGYWSAEEEFEIIWKIRELLTHPNVAVIGQNFLYDAQYFARHHGYIPNLADDTMIKHHVCWSGTNKGLDFLSSLYCEFHQYWKNEGKEFDIEHHDEERLWIYNCKDAVITFEVNEELNRLIHKLNLEDPYTFQLRQFYPVLKMMLRGIRVNPELKKKLSLDLFDAIASREQALIDMLGHPLNPASPKQMKELFYNDFGIKAIRNRKTGQPTLNAEALQKIAEKDVIFKPLVDTIEEIRSLNIFLSNFVMASLDKDGRMRCSYAIAGPETFRYSSSKDAFGLGANLQTIPKGTEK